MRRVLELQAGCGLVRHGDERDGGGLVHVGDILGIRGGIVKERPSEQVAHVRLGGGRDPLRTVRVEVVQLVLPNETELVGLGEILVLDNERGARGNGQEGQDGHQGQDQGGELRVGLHIGRPPFFKYSS